MGRPQLHLPPNCCFEGSFSGTPVWHEVFSPCHEAHSIAFPYPVANVLLSVVAILAVVSVSAASHPEFDEVIGCHLSKK